MSTSPVDKLFEDRRPIAEMPFGAEEKTPEAREETATRVRTFLYALGVEVADDINRLGCTGVLARGGTVGQAQTLRLGLAGGGVGLPCFVPISRYCLVHETIGGLEPGQVQHHADYVASLSRELTPEEKGKVALVELARKHGRKDGDVAADILSGRDESVLEEAPVKPTDATTQAPDMPTLEQQLYEARLAAGLQATAREQEEAVRFKCTEHSKLDWRCRHCVAQAVVEGALEPAYQLDALGGGVLAVPHTPDQLEVELARLDRDGCALVRVYAQVAVFTRKLARD